MKEHVEREQLRCQVVQHQRRGKTGRNVSLTQVWTKQGRTVSMQLPRAGCGQRLPPVHLMIPTPCAALPNRSSYRPNTLSEGCLISQRFLTTGSTAGQSLLTGFACTTARNAAEHQPCQVRSDGRLRSVLDIMKSQMSCSLVELQSRVRNRRRVIHTEVWDKLLVTNEYHRWSSCPLGSD